MNLSSLPSKILFLLFSIFFLGTGCGSKKKLTNNNTTQKKIPTSVNEFIEESEIFNNSFTGFALYDPEEKKMIYEYDADKYFTPASNTKIFTLYASLEILRDSIPALKYIIKNDSLIFWGTGDPSFLHPKLTDNQQVISFLQSRKEKLFFSSSNFLDKRFGAGWAWDDYTYSFQAEKSSFPIHGNIVLFHAQPDGRSIEVSPKPFENLVLKNHQMGGKTARFQRKEFENIFEYNDRPPSKRGLEKEIPFHYSDDFFVELLNLASGKNITLLDFHMLPSEKSTTLYSVPVDSIYQMMMQKSDNFMAEQLLLSCSNEVFDTMNTRKFIRFFTKEYLKGVADKPLWRDGSGLSRYNLFTPRTIVNVLEKIYLKIPEERIFRIFPTGKKSGTIKNNYAPYVHAKTGTLSNKHCLSGYIKTKKRKTLIFSFMHKDYITSSAPLKKEMKKVLHFIHMKM